MNRSPGLLSTIGIGIVTATGALVLGAVVSGCSTPPSKQDCLQYPITEKKYANDQISTQSALNLAYSSYLRGCTDRSVELNAGGSKTLNLCVQKARQHVKDNILLILDQDIKEK